MGEKPVIKIGHLKITDHLILGVTDLKLKKKMEVFNYCHMETVAKNGWNEIADALAAKTIDGAFILAPTAMDLFKSGVNVKLILFTHKSGSILVKNKAANIQKIEDFAGKAILIPYQLSVHNMLFHKLLAEKGMKPGTSNMPGIDVTLEVVAPMMMNEALKYDEAGEIAGFIVAEPIGSQAIAAGFAEEFHLSKELWSGHPCCVLVMRDEIIGQYPDAVQEITTSLVRSGRSVQAQPENAAIIGAHFLGQDPDVIKAVLTDPRQRISTDELMPVVSDLEIIQDYMHTEMKIMKRKIDMAQFVDLSFAKEAGAK
ncbi:MAG: twin-arginine translocation pathway signal protein [Deltaproteobacteria bacterium]|nr:MAG: twin-arginine translocation pathway signal protein [Deltaproteobacteria bacterium]